MGRQGPGSPVRVGNTLRESLEPRATSDGGKSRTPVLGLWCHLHRYLCPALSIFPEPRNPSVWSWGAEEPLGAGKGRTSSLGRGVPE